MIFTKPKLHTWIAVGLMSGLLLLVAMFATFKTDVSDFFFQGASSETALIASRIQSGELSKRYILLLEVKKEGVDSVAFVQDFQGQLNAVDGIARVWKMQQDKEAFVDVLSDYLPYRMQLFSTQPEHDIAQLFQQGSLNQRAAQLKQALLSQERVWLKPLILQDPMMLTADWIKKLGVLRQGSTSEQGVPQALGMMVETKVSGLDAKAQQPILQNIRASFDKVNEKYHGIFSLRVTGVPVFAMAIQKQVSQDMQLISMISIALMIILFVSLFRSVWGLVWVSFILLCTVASATLVTSLVFGYTHALTMAIGMTLIGVCVDYPIHAMVHASASREEDAMASTKRIWPSLLLGGATTAVGYIALSFTDHPGLQQLAVFAGVGIGVALLLTRYLLPYFMQGHVHRMNVGLELKGLLALVQKHRLVKQVVVLCVAVILCAIGFSHLEWTDDMRKLSPSLTALKVEDKAIRKQLSSIEAGRFVLVQADSLEQALQRNEQVFTALEALKSEGSLDAFHSLYPWLASEALQQKNLKVFSHYLTEKYQKMWQQALHKQGLSVKHLGSFGVVNTGILSQEKLESWGHKNFVHGQYLEQDGQVLMMTWLGPHHAGKVKEVLAGIDGVQYISQSDLVNQLAADYRSQTLNMLWFGAAAILLLLLVRFRSLRTALNIVFPAVISVGVVMAMWGILGADMGMLHLIGLLLAIAICVDYAIFFYENRSENQGVTFQAIVVSSMTTIAAFISLGFADNPALQAMAWTVAPGVFLGFLLCPLLVSQQQTEALKKELV